MMMVLSQHVEIGRSSAAVVIEEHLANIDEPIDLGFAQFLLNHHPPAG
jgi:hypothetical protein